MVKMFDDETVDIACPNCGQINSIPVRDFEASPEARVSCCHCGVMVKVEAEEFRRRLAQVRKELEASPDFDDLMLLRQLDDEGRVPGAVVGTVDEALDFLKELERSNG